VIGGGGIKLASDATEGNGAILFRDPLPEVERGHEFDLNFGLDDQGGLVFVSHADAALEHGFKTRFRRAGDLIVASVWSGSRWSDEMELPGLSANGIVQARIGISLSGGSARFILSTRAESDFEVRFDSSKVGIELPAAADRRWGFELAGARISGAEVRPLPFIEEEKETDFSVADLHATALKAVRRFQRLAIPGSQFVSAKTWKTPTYTWVTLQYSVRDAAGIEAMHSLYLACHYHGNELGCHKKDAAGPGEPPDEIHSGELPEELPEIIEPEG
jgi:hypothetical protein